MFLVKDAADDPRKALFEEGRLTDLASLLQEDVSQARASRNTVKESEALSSLVFLFGMLDQWPDAVKAARANLKALKSLGCASAIAGGGSKPCGSHREIGPTPPGPPVTAARLFGVPAN